MVCNCVADMSCLKMGDLKLHSFLFRYLAINLWSTDGQPHSVQLYSDISGGQFLFSSHSVTPELKNNIQNLSLRTSQMQSSGTQPRLPDQFITKCADQQQIPQQRIRICQRMVYYILLLQWYVFTHDIRFMRWTDQFQASNLTWKCLALMLVIMLSW